MLVLDDRFRDIRKEEIEIVTHAQKSVLFHEREIWIKNKFIQTSRLPGGHMTLRRPVNLWVFTSYDGRVTLSTSII